MESRRVCEVGAWEVVVGGAETLIREFVSVGGRGKERARSKVRRTEARRERTRRRVRRWEIASGFWVVVSMGDWFSRGGMLRPLGMNFEMGSCNVVVMVSERSRVSPRRSSTS